MRLFIDYLDNQGDAIVLRMCNVSKISSFFFQKPMLYSKASFQKEMSNKKNILKHLNQLKVKR